MKTRCPGCGTRYNIERSLLKQSRGLARCYDCGEVFNALRDGQGRDRPPPSPLVPDRGGASSRGQAEPERELPFDIPDNLPPLPPSPAAELLARDTLHPGAPVGARWWQKMLLGMLLLLLGAQLAWMQRDQWIHHPRVTQLCIWLQCSPPPEMRPDLFSVVDREMEAISGDPPALRLQLSFRNDAARSLPLPRLQLSLMDGNGSLAARRLLDPAEYLPSGWSGPSVALPREMITIELIFEDPGPRIRSYVFDFV